MNEHIRNLVQQITSLEDELKAALQQQEAKRSTESKGRRSPLKQRSENCTEN